MKTDLDAWSKKNRAYFEMTEKTGWQTMIINIYECFGLSAYIIQDNNK